MSMQFVLNRIRENLFNNLESDCMETLKDLFEIYKNNENDLNLMKLELLNYSNDTYDYFDLIIIDAFFETMYSYGILDKDITDNKRIPNGSNNAYGKYFEKKIISYIEGIYKLKSIQKFDTDAIFEITEGNDFLLEVKCGHTDTKKQVDKYLSKTGLTNFVTINGTENSIKLTQLDVYRMAKKITEEVILIATLKKIEEFK